MGRQLLLESRLTRAAWIETAWGSAWGYDRKSRGSHGPRGLKHAVDSRAFTLSRSRLTRAAWIETGWVRKKRYVVCGSRLTRAAWIETVYICTPDPFRLRRGSHGPRGLKQKNRAQASMPGVSRLTRAAWIETCGREQGDTRKCWGVGAPHFEGCSGFSLEDLIQSGW